jgi:cytoskeletal protein CcmA (bactofilin family)
MFRKESMETAAQTEDMRETVISRTASFSGTLKSDSTIKVYGSVEGEIESTGSVIIGKAARVVAKIGAKDIGVAGTVIGNVSAQGRLEIYSGGSVLGDIASANLMISDGATFIGQCLMAAPEQDTLLLDRPKDSAVVDDQPSRHE